MRYSGKKLISKLNEMRKHSETEIVEFKEAKRNYGFKDIGQYFSAMSNEANLRHRQEAWLIFGVPDNGDIVGSA